MFIAALFLIAKRWKQSKYPSTYEWINKMWYIHTMQYYSAMKKGYQQGFPGGSVVKNLPVMQET